MVERRRSVEVPLTRQISVLRKSRSLRDPVTSSSTRHSSSITYDSPSQENKAFKKENCEEVSFLDKNVAQSRNFFTSNYSESENEETASNDCGNVHVDKPVMLHNWKNASENRENRTSHGNNKFEGAGNKCTRACNEDYFSKNGFELAESEEALSVLSISNPHYIEFPSSGDAKRGFGRRIKVDSHTPILSLSERDDDEEEECISSVQCSCDGENFSCGDETDGFSFQKNGCGIPCYWSRTPKSKNSSTSTISKGFVKRKNFSNFSLHKTSPMSEQEEIKRSSDLDISMESLPLLTEGGYSSSAFGGNIGLLSDRGFRKFNRKKRRFRGRENMELALAPNSNKLIAYADTTQRNLCQKYRPKSFEDIVGQNMVVQSLVNAILKGKIAPVYLFQGPRGTGKTSTARVFAASLNCLSVHDIRPCGYCRECTGFKAGGSVDVHEIDATNRSKLQKVRVLLRNIDSIPAFSRFKIFIVDECHILSAEAWGAFLKYLEEPPPQVVFIFVTSDPDKLPSSAASRCQKFLFPKIKDSEVVSRLQKLAFEENLDVDEDALGLIAIKSDGSLRDAEMMLDQLSLLGQRIDLSMVHDLIGAVSDESLLDLLDLAFSADAASTVKRVRELLSSGVEPMALMSQLATLIMDILASSCKSEHNKQKEIFRHQHTLTEEVLQRLRRALRILSEAEKQLRSSTDQTTWLTAALLQFAPTRSFLSNSTSSSVIQSPLGNSMERPMLYWESPFRQKWDKQGHYGVKLNQFNMNTGTSPMALSGRHNLKMLEFGDSNADNKISAKNSAPFHCKCDKGSGTEDIKRGAHSGSGEREVIATEMENLEVLWRQVVEDCGSRSLRKLLETDGKLVSISAAKDTAIAHIEFSHQSHIHRAESSWKSIATSLQQILHCKVQLAFELSIQESEAENFNSETEMNQQDHYSKDNQKVHAVDESPEEKDELNIRAAKSDQKTDYNKPACQEHQKPVDSVQENLKFPIENKKLGFSNVQAPVQKLDQCNEYNSIDKGILSFDGRGHERVWSKERKKPNPQLSVIPEKKKIHFSDVREQNNEKQKLLRDKGCLALKEAHECSHKKFWEEEEEEYTSDIEVGNTLCWKMPKLHENKVREEKEEQKKRTEILAWIVPCGCGKNK